MYQNQEKISLQALLDRIPSRTSSLNCIGLSGAEKAYLASRIYQQHSLPMVVIVSTPKDAENFLEDLDFFSGKKAIPAIYYPSYNMLPFKEIAFHSNTTAQRIRALYRLVTTDKPLVVVTTVAALLQKILPKQELCNFAELVMASEDLDRDHLIPKLLSGGYTHSILVEEPGDFCVRGGILDVFSPLYADPLRIEFFGDTVDSIRFFSAADQRTIESVREAVILPAREAVLHKECIDEIIGRIRKQAALLELPVSQIRKVVNRIKEEGVFPGIESLVPLVYPELDTFFEYVSDQALFMLMETLELNKTAQTFEEQTSNNFASACEKGRLCVEPAKLYLEWAEAKKILYSKNPLSIQTLPIPKTVNDDRRSIEHYAFSVKDHSALSIEIQRCRENGLLSPLANWIKEQQQSRNAVFLICSTPAQADRLKSLLLPYGIQPKFIDGFPEKLHPKDPVYLCLGQISCGFEWPAEFLSIITEKEIFGTKKKRQRISRHPVRTELLAFQDLKKDDLVVHVEHGIGQYQGLVKLKLNGTSNDFMLIVYKDEDKLYLPVDRMSMIQKYMGVDGVVPSLDKMGGKSWERVKDRVKRSAEKIAGELLELYAQRKIQSGFAFEDIGQEARNFEAGFPYVETEDQLLAIEEVLQDMQAPLPMDRLVCGDVGYGKTEVALRAAFACVYNHKQVAVLVPTTVLAEQHFATFFERFERYPINIACLSRFRSPKTQREIINGLKTGQIDIVIGTHRLLQKDVVFKDLGLFVIDEEQRFGVKHKERLKKIRRTVDVLALTATPIPRTLHLSLMGVRDISIISTPPEQRKSIITYISEFEDAIVIEAVRKELDRNGQIFFVHNNTHNIWALANYLQELIPEVRLDVAHGQMDEDDLEQAMLRFFNRETDMLVSTTIIESGLDIPSANTILINRADRFGLAQIYQLRGRVGRMDEQAYAYLFIPSESTLGKDAQKRLKVLMEYSDLGSGFQIAMSDLRIRGGGTILGASQSGHIAAVGYDMFLKLMENAMAELKGEAVEENLEPEINIVLSTSIPETYMPDIDQRLSSYRRLAKMTGLKDIAEFKAELIDRFGPLPIETENLLLKIMLKVMAIKAGVQRLDLVGNRLSLSFSEKHQKNPAGMIDLVVSNGQRFEFSLSNVLKVGLSAGAMNSLLLQTKNILKEIALHVNS